MDNEAGPHARTTLTGATVGIDVSASEKVWKTFQAIGDIAFAYAYSTVLVEIQATLLPNIYLNLLINILSYVYICMPHIYLP